MKNKRHFVTFDLKYLIFALCVIFAQPALAEIPGVSHAGPAGPNAKTSTGEAELPEVRRIFSSQLKNAMLAEKMDRIYAKLEGYLWSMSVVDQMHQKKLMDLMELKKFKYTRRLAEFKKPMAMAMDDLNKHNDSMDLYIEQVDSEFVVFKGEFKEEQVDAEKLWSTKKDELKTLSNGYFKMQAQYLNYYNDLVKYIMERAGGYYYDNSKKVVSFYKIEEYTYFAETLDKMNKIAFKQRKTLREIKPLESEE